MKIKKLKWKEDFDSRGNKDGFEARPTPGLQYDVFEYPTTGQFWLNDHNSKETQHKSMSAAKKAAQRKFNKYVRKYFIA